MSTLIIITSSYVGLDTKIRLNNLNIPILPNFQQSKSLSDQKTEFDSSDGKILVNFLQGYLCTGSSDWVSFSVKNLAFVVKNFRIEQMF